MRGCKHSVLVPRAKFESKLKKKVLRSGGAPADSE